MLNLISGIQQKPIKKKKKADFQTRLTEVQNANWFPVWGLITIISSNINIYRVSPK